MLTAWTAAAIQPQTGLQRRVQSFFETPEHTNNWAILVCTSRFWFNYRHVANVLSLYHSVKRLGIPDRLVFWLLSFNSFPCYVLSDSRYIKTQKELEGNCFISFFTVRKTLYSLFVILGLNYEKRIKILLFFQYLLYGMACNPLDFT